MRNEEDRTAQSSSRQMLKDQLLTEIYLDIQKRLQKNPEQYPSLPLIFLACYRQKLWSSFSMLCIIKGGMYLIKGGKKKSSATQDRKLLKISPIYSQEKSSASDRKSE